MRQLLKWKQTSPPYIALGLLLLFISVIALVACQAESTAEMPTDKGIRTWLLVRAPDTPLPVNKPLTVKARTEDNQGVSHVELYAVQLPSGEQDLLLDAQPAGTNQTSFTSEQTIIPTQKGHYAIKVVGYNQRGEQAESETISFEIE